MEAISDKTEREAMEKGYPYRYGALISRAMAFAKNTKSIADYSLQGSTIAKEAAAKHLVKEAEEFIAELEKL